VLGKDAEIQHELAFRTEALAREKDFSAKIVGSIISGLMILDGEGNVVMLNDEAKHIHGVPAQKDYLAVHYSSIFQPRVNDGIKDLLGQVQEKGPKASLDRLLVDEDLVLSWKCYAVYDPGHRMVGTLHLFEDITKQESTERQLLQAEKLATIGTMLSGVAHELRNPLAIISGRSQRLLSKKEKFDEWSVRYLQSIEEQTTRCGQIVNNLLNFSRRESAGYNLYDINAVLDEVLTYVDYQNIFDSIHVTKKYGLHVFVFCDKLQMTQVFLNLILNAADAMNGKGELMLSTRQEAEKTVISVSDSGDGIDPKVIGKIFDPFFTTKEAGKGTGLGLSISYRIVQQHGGEIRVHSKPHDTVFEVILPTKR
jgi:two-component system, NtrC family, sensor kinase